MVKVAARCVHVTELTPQAINGTRSLMVAPDGSREGWEESNAGDATFDEALMKLARKVRRKYGTYKRPHSY